VVAVRAASVNHVNVPVAHVALNIEFWPEQIVEGLADAAVGAAGVGVTVTITSVAGLLHTPFTHDA
jgi:hypothetical protein